MTSNRSTVLFFLSEGVLSALIQILRLQVKVCGQNDIIHTISMLESISLVCNCNVTVKILNCL